MYAALAAGAGAGSQTSAVGRAPKGKVKRRRAAIGASTSTSASSRAAIGAFVTTRSVPAVAHRKPKRHGGCHGIPQSPQTPFKTALLAASRADPKNGSQSQSSGSSKPTVGHVKPAIGGSQQSITHWLEDMRRQALQGATWKSGKLFVDLFSGRRSPVGRQVRRRGGAVLAFDILIDPRFDLSNPMVQETLQRWVQEGLVWGVWLGTECTTWSLASYSKGPGWFNSYRTRQNLWGELKSLSPKAQAKVLKGNADAQFSLKMLRLILKQPLAVAGMENPAGSVIWHLAEFQSLEREPAVHVSTCHYCQYGARWKKPTKFLFVRGAKALAPCKRCQPLAARCSRTKMLHLKLGGGRRHPSSGRLLTQLATEYPLRLAAQLVDCLGAGSS